MAVDACDVSFCSFALFDSFSYDDIDVLTFHRYHRRCIDVISSLNSEYSDFGRSSMFLFLIIVWSFHQADDDRWPVDLRRRHWPDLAWPVQMVHFSALCLSFWRGVHGVTCVKINVTMVHDMTVHDMISWMIMSTIRFCIQLHRHLYYMHLAWRWPADDIDDRYIIIMSNEPG